MESTLIFNLQAGLSDRQISNKCTIEELTQLLIHRKLLRLNAILGVNFKIAQTKFESGVAIHWIIYDDYGGDFIHLIESRLSVAVWNYIHYAEGKIFFNPAYFHYITANYISVLPPPISYLELMKISKSIARLLDLDIHALKYRHNDMEISLLREVHFPEFFITSNKNKKLIVPYTSIQALYEWMMSPFPYPKPERYIFDKKLDFFFKGDYKHFTTLRLKQELTFIMVNDRDDFKDNHEFFKHYNIVSEDVFGITVSLSDAEEFYFHLWKQSPIPIFIESHIGEHLLVELAPIVTSYLW